MTTHCQVPNRLISHAYPDSWLGLLKILQIASLMDKKLEFEKRAGEGSGLYESWLLATWIYYT